MGPPAASYVPTVRSPNGVHSMNLSHAACALTILSAIQRRRTDRLGTTGRRAVYTSVQPDAGSHGRWRGRWEASEGYATTGGLAFSPRSRLHSCYMAALTADDFERAFRLYFEEMDRCAAMGCYWALLHVLLALPDVSAALESPEAGVGDRYKGWCRQYLSTPALSAEEFYELRCALLHQGQALGTEGRYTTFSFAVANGISIHRVVVASEKNITLDPRQMVGEMKSAIRRWFADLLKPENAMRLAKVNANLQLLVKQQMKELPWIGGLPFGVYSST